MKKLLASILASSFMLSTYGFTTITASAAEETTFTAVVNVYNDETQEPVTGIDVKFVEYDADLPTIPEPQANVVQVLSEWNTSDVNPYEISDITFTKGHFYAVQIDNIPEGYCYSWEDHVITGIHGNGTLSGTVNYNIALQPHNPLPNLEYPLDIEREFTFSVVDKSTNQVIEGLDVELAEMELDTNVVNKYNYVETVDSWNTVADSHAITIPITYDTYDSPSAVFGIKINNMPEGYTYYQEPQDGYTVCAYYGAYDYRYDLYKNNTKTECIAYIYPDDMPHEYTSTAASNSTGTTTTTTTTTTTVPDVDEPITTSTAIADYITFLDYDSFPMKAGETRTVHFYNPELPTMTKMTAYEVSENISYVYEEGSDTLTITALAPGNARMYIMGEGCAFGCYLNIEVVDDTLTTTTTTVAGAGTTTTTTTTTTVAGEGTTTTTTTTTTIADEETTTTTTVINNDEELPQTGYSNIYKVIAGFATLMTIGGASLVVKTRKENE